MTKIPNQPRVHDSSIIPASSTLWMIPQLEIIDFTASIQLQNMELQQLCPPAATLTKPPNNDTTSSSIAPTKGRLMTATISPSMLIQSQLERLLNNIHDQQSVLWLLNTVSRISNQPQLHEPDPIHTHPINSATSKPYLLDPTQYNINNSLLAFYATSPYNLAFDIHPKLSPQVVDSLCKMSSVPFTTCLQCHPSLQPGL